MWLQAGNKRKKQDWPFVVHFVILCAAIAFPLLLLSAYLLYETTNAEVRRVEQSARDESGDLALLVERDLASLKTLVQVLASSPALHRGDLDAFDRRARDAVALQSDVHLVLRSPNRQPLLNTRLPPGAQLPVVSPDASETGRSAPQTEQGRVSDLFVEPVPGASEFIVEVPVSLEGEVRYLLSATVTMDHLDQLVRSKKLQQGWWAGLVDRKGGILMSTLPQTLSGPHASLEVAQAMDKAQSAGGAYMRFPGGQRDFVAFHTVKSAGWTVLVAVPEEILLQPFRQFLWRMGLLVAFAVLGAGLMAYRYGHIITGGVKSLTEAATALGQGKLMHLPETSVREIDAANAALAAAERELGERVAEREVLLKTLGRSPSFIWSFADGPIMFWGSGAQRLYGYTMAEAIGRTSHDLLATEFPMPIETINAALLKDGVWEGELRHRTKNGAILTVASLWALRRDPVTGEASTVVETNTDLTAIKAADRRLIAAKLEAEAANRAKTAFLSAVSHDLRQPFQALRLFQQVLVAQASPGQAAVLANMDKALASGEELLVGLVELSVLERGKVECKPAVFALDELLADLAEECRPMAQANGLSLRRVESHLAVRSDRALLKRMLRNLVVNAIRYTRSGGVLIGCRRKGGRVLIQVVDTGVGIPEDKLAKIFEEFYRLEETVRDQAPGLGLGLAIVRRLSHLLGHPIHVRSTSGRGSTFSVEMEAQDLSLAVVPVSSDAV